MLNIFKNKQNNFNDKSLNTNYIIEKSNKIQSNSERDEYNNIIFHHSSSKEWLSSVYSYNKSYLKSLISKDAVLNTLLRSYCNMLQDKIKILFKRRRDNKIRYSANKIYASRAELKHTNTKLLIILSMYNKQKRTLLKWTRKILYIKRMYKILVEYKDRYIVTHKRIFTTLSLLLKNMTHKSRIILVEKRVKIKHEWVTIIERYIPANINRLNHKLNLLFKRKLFLFRKIINEQKVTYYYFVSIIKFFVLLFFCLGGEAWISSIWNVAQKDKILVLGYEYF